MKIGITGATGHLGRLVIEKLKIKTSSSDIIALVRSTAKAAELGIEVREFDYDKPESLAGALNGIDTLLLISGNEIGQRARQHLNVIEAAKAADVKRIVYTSLLHADNSSLNLAGEHLATEAAIKDSGIPYTLLRNGWYSENYTGFVQGAVMGGAGLGSAGEGKIAFAPRADYAEAAAVVLAEQGHEGKVYELTGDKGYTLGDLAGEISRQTGKTIAYKNLSEAEYAAVLKQGGLPEAFAGIVASWDTSASKGDMFDDSRQLSKLIGRPSTSLEQSVKQILSTLQ